MAQSVHYLHFDNYGHLSQQISIILKRNNIVYSIKALLFDQHRPRPVLSHSRRNTRFRYDSFQLYKSIVVCWSSFDYWYHCYARRIRKYQLCHSNCSYNYSRIHAHWSILLTLRMDWIRSTIHVYRNRISIVIHRELHVCIFHFSLMSIILFRFSAFSRNQQQQSELGSLMSSNNDLTTALSFGGSSQNIDESIIDSSDRKMSTQIDSDNFTISVQVNK